MKYQHTAILSLQEVIAAVGLHYDFPPDSRVTFVMSSDERWALVEWTEEDADE